MYWHAGGSVIIFLKEHRIACGTMYSATDFSGCIVPQPSSVLSCNENVTV